MNNEGESGRENGVVKDILFSKPEGGYTARTLKATFERTVQSRLVIKEVMSGVYAASNADALGDVIASDFYSTLKTDLISAQEVYSHQGDVLISKLIPFLTDSLASYNSLAPEEKKAVNEAVYSQKATIAKSWTGYHLAIKAAIEAEVAKRD